MSLISDPDYLIHSLRLNYLRNVEDTYGARLISLDPIYHSNPYILAAGMADVERWPELAMPSSPAPSDDEHAGPGQSARPSGFPGAKLKYTTTIVGPSRVGAAGLGVARKRTSTSKRFSVLSRKEGIAAAESDPEDGAATSPAQAPSGRVDSGEHGESKEAAAEPDAAHEAAALVHIPMFIPKFKGAAEMEARRRIRMLNRAPTEGPPQPPVPPQANLNPELSSSSESEPEPESESGEDDDDEEEDALQDDDEFDDLAQDAEDSMDIGDEFDPEFADNHASSASDGVSLLSTTNSIASTFNASSVLTSSLPQPASVPPSSSARNRLSPVREGRHSEENESSQSRERIDGYFEMVTPAPATSTAPPSAATGDGMFAREPVPPIASAKSALSAMLAASSSSSGSNPFAELYSAISGRAETASVTVRVFFPHAHSPDANKSDGEAMELSVRKDATVEEVLGFALWSYWEEGWLPHIDEGIEGLTEEDEKWKVRCSAVGWILRIAEEDGEVDEDFPPPDRTGKISKFNFDAYAVLEASTTQVQQNRLLESKIQRRASRIVVKKKKSTGLLAAVNAAAPADVGQLGTSAVLGSLTSSLGMFSGSLGPSNSHGPPLFLRIRIADTADAGHVSTTIQASGGMYMAEVLEAVCQKRKLSNPKDYALLLDLGNGGKIENDSKKLYIPLDRTVKSLQGKRDLILVKFNMLHVYGVEIDRKTGRTTDPNASILKRNSEVPEQIQSSLFDYTSAYRKYTVYRKVPMLVTRSARLLAIDGGYIHIMPAVSKAKNVFDSGKTSSYHMRSVIACQQSSKNSATFKLVVRRDEVRNKRYEFEAENAKVANEIVQTIRSLKMAQERSGTTKQSRRSRHVS